MNILKKLRSRLSLRLVSGFTTLFLIVTVAFCLFFTLQSLSAGYVSFFGTSVFRVVTGSMEPEISVGALLITKKTPIWQIQEQDIVCYRSVEPALGPAIITHRVVAIHRGPDGGILLLTKGDANSAIDPNPVSEKQLIGRVVRYTGDGSKMAELIRFLTSDFGFMACIILPVLLIAGWIFRDAIQGMKEAINDAQQKLNKQNETAEPAFSEQEYAELYQRMEEELRKEMEQSVRENAQNADGNVFEVAKKELGDDPQTEPAAEVSATAPTDQEVL